MKLSSLTIFIIGLSLSLVVVSYALFHHFIPNSDEASRYDEVLTLWQAESAKMPQATKRRDDAVELVRKADRDWAVVAATRTPSASLPNGIDLSVNRWQLMIDTRKYRNTVQRQVNRQVLTGGVRVINGPYVPGIDTIASANDILSYFNMPPYAFPVVIYDLGQVVVEGTYDQIVANVRSWTRMPNYIAMADGLSLTGTSPRLTGTYNVQVVGFMRTKTMAAPVPEVASAGGGAGAGAFGPGPGGFPGAGGFRGPGGPPPGLSGVPGSGGGFGGPSGIPPGAGGRNRPGAMGTAAP